MVSPDVRSNPLRACVISRRADGDLDGIVAINSLTPRGRRIAAETEQRRIPYVKCSLHYLIRKSIGVATS